MITELKVGDYFELSSEQEYNDVVEVLKQWGIFDKSEGYDGRYDFTFVDEDKTVDQCYTRHFNLYCKRKLTYSQVMSLKKVDNSNEPKKDGNKYHREIIGFCGTKVEIDIYRVLDAYQTGSASLDHAAKKILCTGIRGHKDYVTDIDNAIESLQEAKALHLQKLEIDNA